MTIIDPSLLPETRDGFHASFSQSMLSLVFKLSHTCTYMYLVTDFQVEECECRKKSVLRGKKPN